MNAKTVISAIMAVSLASGGFAYADGHGDGNNRGRYKQSQHGGQQQHHDNDGRPPEHRDHQGHAYTNIRWNGHGAAPFPEMYRGGHLPPQYHHTNYVVDDWRGHDLHAPPRGYHWVQTGNDYVLVAIATGIILELMMYH